VNDDRQLREASTSMQRWDLTAAQTSNRSGPRVLFSTPEARGVVIDLAPGEELGDHRVRERALLLVVHGAIAVTGDGTRESCPQGTLVLFEPGEPHVVHAVEQTRLLLTLAPWPAADHYQPDEREDPHQLPAHATQPPV
jgi:quercetin dioxygenase-like cupin family protein